MIRYRFATQEDLNLLVELRLQFLEAKTNQRNFMDIFLNTRQFFEQKLADGNFQCILAYDDNKVIGEAFVYYESGIPTLFNLTGVSAYITNLYVNIKYRRNGIGAFLLQSLMQSIKEKQIHTVCANLTDQSEKLFEKFCFTKMDHMMLYQD